MSAKLNSRVKVEDPYGVRIKFPKLGSLISMVVRALGSLAICGLLSGCIAGAAMAPLVIGGAASGFGIYKTVQLSTGGEAEVELSERTPDPDDLKTIQSARSIAVWPVLGGEGNISENLSQLTGLDVISPSKVRRWVDDNGLEREANILTSSEMGEYGTALGQHLGADLVLFVEHGKLQGVDQNFWSFDRASIEYDFTMHLNSTLKKRLLWSEPGRLVIEVGGSLPGEDETNGVAQKVIAERVAELTR